MAEKTYSRDITQRFLEAVDHLVIKEKTTYQRFGEMIGVTSSNINRMRIAPDANFVTLETVARMVDQFQISAIWLITGTGDMENNDHLQTIQNVLANRMDVLEKAISEAQQAIQAIKKPLPESLPAKRKTSLKSKKK